MRGGFRFLLRVAIGGLFVASGLLKLRDPLFFLFALRGFRTGLPDPLIDGLAFVLPWCEAVFGLALLLGFWPRAAAAGLGALLLLFEAAILSLLLRDLDVSCPCFGREEFLCGGPLGPCHLLRNAGLLLAAGALVLAGGGMAALRPDALRPGARDRASGGDQGAGRSSKKRTP